MKFSASLLALFALGFYVLAAPVSPPKRDVIATLNSVVSGLEASVTGSVEAIAEVVVSSVETEILPDVESNLGNIIEAVGQATAIIVPIVTGTVVGLTVDEVETLLNNLTTLKTIIQQIETTVNSTIPAVLIGTYPRSTPFPISLCAKLCQARAADVLATNAALATEIANLYAVLSPLVRPILAYATSVVSIVKTRPVSEITVIVSEIEAIVGSLVAPIATTAAGVN